MITKKVNRSKLLFRWKGLLLLLITTMVTITCYSQKTHLSEFDNLVTKTWKASGNWQDGSKFEQEVCMYYSLDSAIIIVNSKGFIDEEQTIFGLRNHGIRMYDKKADEIKFWEFDIFGGLTEGSVFAEGKNIVYQYSYGDTFLTEMWEYVDDSTYNFKIGVYEDEIWMKIYLATQFIEIEVNKN